MTTITRMKRGRSVERSTVHIDLARNVALFGGLWLAYAAVRGVAAGELATATQNAHSIIDLQQAIGLPSERALQSAVLETRWLLRGANFYYLGVHFPLTVGFLAWAWGRHRSEFTRIRNALIVTSGVGLVIHVLYPLKPPRMMDGFVDTAAVFGPDPYELGISNGANQIAAMPSLHVAWALLVALGCISIGTTKARWLAAIHPTVTLAVVVLTANHYWADAIAAVAITVVAWRLAGAINRRELRSRPQRGEQPALASGPPATSPRGHHEVDDGLPQSTSGEGRRSGVRCRAARRPMRPPHTAPSLGGGPSSSG